jgi:hypothetical protein
LVVRRELILGCDAVEERVGSSDGDWGVEMRLEERLVGGRGELDDE